MQNSSSSSFAAEQCFNEQCFENKSTTITEVMDAKFVLLLCAAAVLSVAVAMPAAPAPAANAAAPNEDMKTAETHHFGLSWALGGYPYSSFSPYSAYRGLGIGLGINTISPFYNSYGYAGEYPYYY